MKLTCKIGTFRFMPGITLSAAKMIRDSVMGQMLLEPGRSKRFRTAEDVHKYANTVHPDAKRYLFNVELKGIS